MSNGRAMIIYLIAKLKKIIKKILYFLNHVNRWEERSMSKWIYLIIQQNQI